MHRKRLLRAGVGIASLVVANTIAFVAPASATFPGENGLIAFSADTGSGHQIYTVRADGKHLRRLTSLVGDAVNADWSPDGSHIAFELDLPNEAGCHVLLMTDDGTHLRDLTSDANVCEAQPSYTPDGRHLVFERYDPTTNVDAIWRMNLSGGHRREITTGTGNGVTDPNVSPDGSKISFIDYNGTDFGQALDTVRTDGSHLRTVVPFAADVAIKHDWSPDGRRITYTDNADRPTAAANIATVRPNGRRVRPLTHFTDPETRAYVGSYSPDGRWIVFRLEKHGRFALERMQPDGTHIRTILPLSSFKPRFIDWGPQEDGD
jgi:Tol biopolymer transport system component